MRIPHLKCLQTVVLHDLKLELMQQAGHAGMMRDQRNQNHRQVMVMYSKTAVVMTLKHHDSVLIFPATRSWICHHNFYHFYLLQITMQSNARQNWQYQ